MLKILHTRLQQYVDQELPDVQAGFRKGREPDMKLPASVGSLTKQECSRKKSVKQQRHYFANEGLYSQSYGLSSSHVWMWELDHKKGWGQKNWCFLIRVLEKTLKSPLDNKEIKPVNPKGNQP